MKVLKTITKFSWLFIIAILLYSCGEDDESAVVVGDPPVANAGTDITASVGNTVTLDGSSSLDPDDDAITFEWQLIETPTGSSASLNNKNSAVTTFVPDKEGFYKARLVVTDENDNTDDDEIGITIESSSASATTEIGGVIAENTFLENINTDPTLPDYKVTSNLTVDEGVTLTVEEGVTIEFLNSTGMEVNGLIIAEGTVDNPIVFTGEIAEPGTWNGISVFSTDNEDQNIFNHVVIAYGGGAARENYPAANLVVGYKKYVSIKNSEVYGSGDYGIFLSSINYTSVFESNNIHDNVGFPLRVSTDRAHILDEGSTFNVGNGDNSVELEGGISNANVTYTWKKLSNETPYYLTSDYNSVNIVANLVLNDGVHIEVQDDTRIFVDPWGSLKAEGVEGISITGKTKAKGSWKGIVVNSDGSHRSRLEEVTISYGGSSEINTSIPKVNIGVSSSGHLTINSCKITDCDGVGLYGAAGSDVNHSNNTYSNNNKNWELN